MVKLINKNKFGFRDFSYKITDSRHSSVILNKGIDLTSLHNCTIFFTFNITLLTFTFGFTEKV